MNKGDTVVFRGTVIEVAAETAAIEMQGGWITTVPLGDCWPPCAEICAPDCEAGPVHCVWVHMPSHKPGWHSQEDCPVRKDR